MKASYIKKNKIQSKLKPVHSSFRQGFKDGCRVGFDKGYEDGFNSGNREGTEGKRPLFEGTSIIIPTYNQKAFLIECIESIRAYTPEPYELIIIDNGSTDGTLDYLISDTTGIRFRFFDHNLGFAGAVNQGLLMARGTSLVLLNNDTVVTPYWLNNLLACVGQDATIGLAGPVSNYISGEQLIPTNYSTVEEMQQFALSYNRSDSSRWKSISRITAFCLIMRRDVFERIGYFDEGFEIGNCEDDDYGLRAELLGLQLVVAGDTFVHHYGSMTMKSLKEQFAPVYEKNQIYYFDKWGDPSRALMEARQNDEDAAAGMCRFYANCVIVKGEDPTAYWVEYGVRYPINSPIQVPITQVSQLDLKCWHMGPPLSAADVLLKLASLNDPTITEINLRDNIIVTTPDGGHYQLQEGKLRSILSPAAHRTWHLDQRWTVPISYEIASMYVTGNPIIPCPTIRTLFRR
ncbi:MULTISPECIES: glycosyltransferase family 2 protein [unclassified Paenibacillus]|uniref:glycosyltransferase family 2 protein n=1 Tax=unclassified Paenibacillus TaxID=185978 RepID=UPI00277E80C2|nr:MULTISPECIES: glycosyltransferase family 2 protein [unclassified Paenibacillus]MDQ0901568.1 GT2 family glycosyltransferase [Paenibacillus sp. V4I7]MDQ0919930.1 GT2 family glycosyltransferase [Paenibacillus sp. V4I5]